MADDIPAGAILSCHFGDTTYEAAVAVRVCEHARTGEHDTFSYDRQLSRSTFCGADPEGRYAKHPGDELWRDLHVVLGHLPDLFIGELDQCPVYFCCGRSTPGPGHCRHPVLCGLVLFCKLLSILFSI